MRFFGFVDRVPGTAVVATPFAHLGGLPLIPRASHLVTSLTTTPDGAGQRTDFESVPLGNVNGRSAVAAYLRAYGAVAAVFGLTSYVTTAIAHGEPTVLTMIGVGLVFAAWILTFTGRVTISNALEMAGFGLIVGGVANQAVAVSLAIAGAGIVAVAITLPWRTASPARATELERLLSP